LSPVSELLYLPGWITTYLGDGLFELGRVDVFVVLDDGYFVAEEFLENRLGGSDIFTRGSHFLLDSDVLYTLLYTRSIITE